MILEWVQEYAKLLWRFVRGLRPRVPGRVHVDEVFVRVLGKLCPALQAVISRAGYCLDISLERRRDTRTYERFFKRIKKHQRIALGSGRAWEETA